MPISLDSSEHFLTPDEETALLRIGRDALEAWVLRGERIELDTYPLSPALLEHHGAFITLRLAQKLRGCIGYTHNRDPLAFAVRDNAINAARSDPRFPPVHAEELSLITLEVSALTSGDAPHTPFKRVRSLSDIVIGRDGLYIERASHKGGLLLPQVAVEHNMTVEEFLEAVCRKANYPYRSWERAETTLFRFSAQVFSESHCRDA